MSDKPETSSRKEGYNKEAAASKGSLSAPAITLPKGGGAIRGIEEKYSVNPVTGSASFSIPIFVTPSRHDFYPKLSLSYDSGAGNGPFGFGWSLSIPSITRKTEKGLPKYRDSEESDVFILSGAEDLVPVLDASGKPLNIPDRTIQENGVSKTYTIKRYRPRIEGLFARIEKWVNKNTGDTYWRSISRDNITTHYGKTTQARITDPADSTCKRVFQWLIEESRDSKGNVISYVYKPEDQAQIDRSLLSEKNRVNGNQGFTNQYLKRIKYGNKTPNESDFLFELVFDYGEHNYVKTENRVTCSIDEATEWECRPDAFSSYKAGFEIRTYRLCKRVLMFHRFEELGKNPCLVRSTDFNHAFNTISCYSYLTSATQSGYVWDQDHYRTRSLPPVEFTYSVAAIQDRVEIADAASLENLPQGIDGRTYQWIDLDGEGISGVLTEQAEAWFYKANLGGGRFGPLEKVAFKPSLAALSSGRQQLMDLAGDGQLDLVLLESAPSGFYERTSDQRWEEFTPFVTLPNVSWNDPNLKFIDLTGDGHADILITEDDVFTWYPSLAEEGFGPAEKVRQVLDEEKGPRLVFADGTQSIYLADMSGDGLIDIVRIRNGNVCYWPNLGYGRFGSKVNMVDSPYFDHSDQFNQRNIHLADIDGTGTTDIIYLGRDGIDCYFNRSGNGWTTKPHTIGVFPKTDNFSNVMVVDLLGKGTACIVWSSPLPGNGKSPMQYLDLMGEKPHLLIHSRNNLGAETRVEYASSTKFYLQDKRDGRPWITRLPFPVHVVERVEVYDRISRNRFVTRYAYHHGYFDGIEREFRGFGMVEQWDTEEFSALGASDAFPSATNIDDASHVPPALTRTWFHTGAFLEGSRISRQFEDEYYRESDLSESLPGLTDVQMRAILLDDTVLPDTIRLSDGSLVPFNLSAEEVREACRALKGSILRQEIYALDGTMEEDRPYSVSERNYTIELKQPQAPNRHAVFFTYPRETVDFHYERKLYDIDYQKLADPRISHALTLEVDPFGNVLKSAAIGYGRRLPDMTLLPHDQEKQTRTLITFTENSVTNNIDTDNDYRTPLPCETQTYELTGLSLSETNVRFSLDEMLNAGAEAVPIDYEAEHSSGLLQKQLIEHVRTVYSRNDLSGPLPPGRLDSMALPYESYKLAFTPGLVNQVYGTRVTDDMLINEGRYVHSEGDPNWWIPSGKTFYSPDTDDTPARELAFARAHFFLPHRFCDPFGYTSKIAYDSYDLQMEQAIDPLGNVITAENDYRVLQPKMVTDPNGNRAAVAFDVLGLVAGTAVMGKVDENKGDSLAGFEPDLDEGTILGHIQNPLTDPHDILQKATTRLVYDLYVYHRTCDDPQPQPAVIYTMVRETHDADLAPDQLTRVQHSFSYSDGFGREIQKKIQAEPSDVDGIPTDPRWVGSGWTIFNNKGKPVKKYEPFFSFTHQFEFAKIAGVSSTLFYDPIERVVSTLHPNHTYEKGVFDPWQQETWDVNDTVLQADPKSDPDAGSFFSRLQDADYLPTWHDSRKNGELGAEEQETAEKTAAHADTPTITYFDTLGRPFLTIAHNKFEREGATIEEEYATRVNLDIEGNQGEVIDAKNRIVMHYDYDMLSSRIHQASMEAGECWTLNDVGGNPIRAWDSRGHAFTMEYDALRRPIQRFVEGTDPVHSDPRTVGNRILYEKVVYGEDYAGSRADAAEQNLLTRVWKQFDSAGVVTSETYDFKGNLLRSSRRLVKDYKTAPDWETFPEPEDRPDDWEEELFQSSSRYDALNRPIQLVVPHAGSATDVIQPGYNEANLLEKLDVWLKYAGEPAELLTPDTADEHFVTNIDYNAKGQRERIEYGNGVTTEYTYDAETFRLIHLHTTRPPGLNSFAGQLFVHPATVQDLRYAYDPAGNITSIRDDALPVIFYNNQQVTPISTYTYDAIYRLITAEGREHIGQTALDFNPAGGNYRDYHFAGMRAHPNDRQAMRPYTEWYEYDEVGNFRSMTHRAEGGDWVRSYFHEDPSLIEPDRQNNRLSRTTIAGRTETYTHDNHGNMTSMPHLPEMAWDFKDQLHMVDKGGGCMGYYVYDAGGQRVRKVIERQNGAIQKERIYLGGFEVYREYNGSGDNLTLERETLHIMDDKQRIALVETRTQGEDEAPRQLTRYQLGNHLGSASLELDGEGQVISYEEYHPYGTSSYQAVRSQTETPKRYRYTGMERDEETGLNYHGARYCAAWLGRWTSCDPIGIVYGPNLYQYAGANPIYKVDPQGTSDEQSIPLTPVDELISETEITEETREAVQAEYQMCIPEGTQLSLEEIERSYPLPLSESTSEPAIDPGIPITERYRSMKDRLPPEFRTLFQPVSVQQRQQWAQQIYAIGATVLRAGFLGLAQAAALPNDILVSLGFNEGDVEALFMYLGTEAPFYMANMAALSVSRSIPRNPPISRTISASGVAAEDDIVFDIISEAVSGSVAPAVVEVRPGLARIEALLQSAESGQVRSMAFGDELFGAYEHAMSVRQSTAIGRTGFNSLRRHLPFGSRPIHHWLYPINQYPAVATEVENLYLIADRPAHINLHRAMGRTNLMIWGQEREIQMMFNFALSPKR
jgi:RHS repeat-associated protein